MAPRRASCAHGTGTWGQVDYNPQLYRPTVAPFAHQASALARGWRKRNFAYLMEQGTGKTKVALDNAAMLLEAGAINGLLVLAPKDVHAQWVNEQMPVHWPARHRTRTVVWSQSTATRKQARALYLQPIAGRFPILAMNHEALTGADGFRVAKDFCAKLGAVMVVVDESHRIKTPRAIRTRRSWQVGQLAKVRRILTGTPQTQSPFDLYAQFRFLDWRIIGFDSFLSFKHHYGLFAKEYVRQGDALRSYPSLQGYQRLEQLAAKVAPFSYRVTKAQCLDLPPKMYVTRALSLSADQAKLYDHIKEEGFALLQSGDRAKLAALPDLPDELTTRLQSAKDRMTLKIKLTMLLRLQQVAGGFVTDDSGHTRPIDTVCPRVDTVVDLCQQAAGKVVIWSIYVAEIDALVAALNQDMPGSACAYYGATSAAKRQQYNDRFRDAQDPLRFMVAHPKSAGAGRDWPVAQDVVYYSCAYSVEQRVQSEDRVHRIGQQGTVTVYDLRSCSVDQLVQQALQSKRDLADYVMGMTVAQFREVV